MSTSRILRPPFTLATAREKVSLAQNLWNTRNPEKVALAYTPNSSWRNRDKFFTGRDAIVAFLRDKWTHELDYKLEKYLFSFNDNKIAVHFQYEFHNGKGQWFRTYGNEHWTFNEDGLMEKRDMSANDVEIKESERLFK